MDKLIGIYALCHLLGQCQRPKAIHSLLSGWLIEKNQTKYSQKNLTKLNGFKK